jgi:hypothetical protein
MVTLRACDEKNIAAWPAELPAPTMWMSSPWDVTAVELHLMGRCVDSRDGSGDEDFGAEPARLLKRPARQLVARDP